MPSELEEMFGMFAKLGLQRPRRVFAPFGHWDEEGLELCSEQEEAAQAALERLVPRRECTCCECNLHIGPPGCDGTNCKNCGRH